LALDVGLVVLGTGSKSFESDLIKTQSRFRDKMAVKIRFDDALAHRIMAGTDIFMIPSRYEPCGLTQMYALQYGTVPVVRGTGGLEDTIKTYDAESGEGNGFKFSKASSEALYEAVREAVTLFGNREKWRQVQETGMKADYSWDSSAKKYLEVFQNSMESHRASSVHKSGV
jgi:starch synthase